MTTLYITNIDLESKTVTLGNKPPQQSLGECVDPGWQGIIENLKLPDGRKLRRGMTIEVPIPYKKRN